MLIKIQGDYIMQSCGKKILPGIPAMWYGHPSAVCYIGSIMRLMEFIGDPVDESELFSLSGAGLCFPWRSNSSCDEISIIPEIPSHTFESFGYESEYIPPDSSDNKEVLFEKIKHSIDHGIPVIGFGITVKMPMTCLITGYDDNGLYSRSFWPPDGWKYDSEEYYYSSDWYENFFGMLTVGNKIACRLKGAEAYACIANWAAAFLSYDHPVTAEGMQIYINQNAFDAMVDWLSDDTQWIDPISNDKEQFLKQCGLLLFNHYRYHLYEHLKIIESGYPGTVNKAVFTAIERIQAAVPGSHTSDLWLNEAVDPALMDFSAIRDRMLRDKVINYVRHLKEFDTAVLQAF